MYRINTVKNMNNKDTLKVINSFREKYGDEATLEMLNIVLEVLCND